MYGAFEHTLAVPLQFPQAESPNIRIIGLKNAVDTRNQFSPSQYKGLLSVTLFRTGRKDRYQAVVPGEDVISRWDFMCLIEVMDNKGNGKIYLDLEKETPYVMVKLRR